MAEPQPIRSDSEQDLLARVRGEFLEMPGLQLTLAQAARLWQLDLETADGLLRALVDCRFLAVRDGRFTRQ